MFISEHGDVILNIKILNGLSFIGRRTQSWHFQYLVD